MHCDTQQRPGIDDFNFLAPAGTMLGRQVAIVFASSWTVVPAIGGNDDSRVNEIKGMRQCEQCGASALGRRFWRRPGVRRADAVAAFGLGLVQAAVGRFDQRARRLAARRHAAHARRR